MATSAPVNIKSDLFFRFRMIVGCLAFLAVQMATGQDASPEKNYPVSSTAERCALYVTSPEQMINDAMREVDALSNIMVTKLRPFLSLDLSVLEEKISYSLPTHMLPFKWPSVIKDLDTFLEETDKDYQGTIDRVAQKFAHFYWADPALAERSLKKTVKIQFDVLAKMIKKYGSSYSDDTIHDDFYFSLLAYTTLQVLHDCFAKLKCGEGPEQIINDGVIEFLEFFLHYDKELSPEQKERASKIALKLTKPHSIGLLQQDIVLNLFKRWFPDPDGDDVAETVANNFSKIIDPLAQENGPFIYQLLPRQKVAAKGGPAVKEATPYPRQVLQTIGRHDLSTSQQKQLHRSYAKIFNEHISYHDLETKEYLEVLNKIQYPYIIFNQDRFINDHLPHLIDNPGFPDVFYEAFSNTLDTMDRDLFPAKAPSNKDINAIEEYDEFFARGILPFVKVLQEIRRLHIQRGSAELPEAYWRTLHFLLRFIYVQARDLDTEAKKAKNDEDHFPLVVDNYFNAFTQLIPLISPRDAESLTICLDFYDYWVEHDHSPSIWQHIEDKFGVGVKQIQASPRGQFYVLATLPLIYPLLKDNERFKQGNYFMRAWDEWTPPLARSCIYLSELQPRTARCMEYYPGPNFSADLIGLYTYFFRKVPRDPNLNWPERWEAASDDNQRLEVLYEYLMHQPFFGENWLENIKPEYPDQSVEEEAFEKMALTAHLIPPFAYKTAYYQNLVFAMLRQMAKKIPKSILMSDSGPKSVHGVVDLEYPQPHWVKQIFAKKKKNVYSFQVLQNLIKWTSALPNLQAYMAANYSQLTTAEYRQLLDLAIYTWAHQALALSGPAKQDKARAVLPKITDAIKGIISLAGNEDKNSSWYQLMVMITNYYLRGEDSLSLIKDLQEHIAQFTGDRDLPILKMDPQAILDREVKRYELVLWAQLTNAHATNRKLGLILISLINPSHTPDNYALYDSSMANIFVSYRLNKIASGNIVKAQYQAAQDLNQKIEQTLSANAPYQEIKHRLDDIKQGKNYKEFNQAIKAYQESFQKMEDLYLLVASAERMFKNPIFANFAIHYSKLIHSDSYQNLHSLVRRTHPSNPQYDTEFTDGADPRGEVAKLKRQIKGSKLYKNYKQAYAELRKFFPEESEFIEVLHTIEYAWNALTQNDDVLDKIHKIKKIQQSKSYQKLLQQIEQIWQLPQYQEMQQQAHQLLAQAQAMDEVVIPGLINARELTALQANLVDQDGYGDPTPIKEFLTSTISYHLWLGSGRPFEKELIERLQWPDNMLGPSAFKNYWVREKITYDWLRTPLKPTPFEFWQISEYLTKHDPPSHYPAWSSKAQGNVRKVKKEEKDDDDDKDDEDEDEDEDNDDDEDDDFDEEENDDDFDED